MPTQFQIHSALRARVCLCLDLPRPCRVDRYRSSMQGTAGCASGMPLAETATVTFGSSDDPLTPNTAILPNTLPSRSRDGNPGVEDLWYQPPPLSRPPHPEKSVTLLPHPCHGPARHMRHRCSTTSPRLRSFSPRFRPRHEISSRLLKHTYTRATLAYARD